MTHLLDSSAFFAFFFGEPGSERVEELLADSNADIGLSALTGVEFWARLKAEGREDVFEQEWEEHLLLFERVVPVDMVTCHKAIELRRAAAARVPTIDSLIAASAALKDAVLVHCDPHFNSIPTRLLKQEAVR